MARRLFAFFISYHLILIISTISRAQLVQPDKHVSLFIFGDSFLDAGNNNYIKTRTIDQANYRPYGETYFNFPTGRFSDSRLISDFIAEYANLPLVPPFLQPSLDQYFFGAILHRMGQVLWLKLTKDMKFTRLQVKSRRSLIYHH
ncbi:GDSL esterase/lipase 5 isoform X2 [Ricinus communis]|nr:GDSL esterase/lipase 5 isoform X2 [Ricinus communis]|eukprot:XP_002533239.2 GDSL esterase/lipase 5 [Ricinus communis]